MLSKTSAVSISSCNTLLIQVYTKHGSYWLKVLTVPVKQAIIFAPDIYNAAMISHNPLHIYV